MQDPMLLCAPRIPEPEVMDHSEEVEAYASAAAKRHLARLDSRFVRSVARSHPANRILDVGCGPGQIPLAYLYRRRRESPDARAFGVDLSLPMLREARRNGFTSVAVASGAALPFQGGAFDLVLSNSVLHHLADPAADLAEMTRCVAPGGTLLVRDLKRPLEALAKPHMAFLGRHYSGRMKELFEASVRAAYTPTEARRLLAQAHVKPARVRRRGLSYLEAEWRRLPA